MQIMYLFSNIKQILHFFGKIFICYTKNYPKKPTFALTIATVFITKSKQSLKWNNRIINAS